MTNPAATRSLCRAFTLAAPLAIAVSALGVQSAAAQAIERNLPPAPMTSSKDIAAPNLVPSNADSTPIGPALTSLVILGDRDSVLTAAGAGVDVSRAPRLARDQRRLARFLGQPISRNLIARIETQIAILYRDQGYPFVNLSTPPQELTGGVLQIRAAEFRVGAKTAPGAKGATAYVESRVRVAPGEPINTTILSQDLDWLDRYPFRNTTAVFTPGTTPGTTDLQLQTTTTKPWSAYFGYSNSGSSLTGFSRYFAGAQTTLPFLHDAVISYQYTGSPDAVFNGNVPFQSAANPTYYSHAGRLLVPTLARQDIEVTVDDVQTYEAVPNQNQNLYTRLNTLEGTLAYRAALSDFLAFLPGDGLIGIEAKNELSHTYFGGSAVAEQSLNVYQGIVGWTYSGNDPLGHTNAGLTVHFSPGGVDDRNTAAAFSAFSNKRFHVDQYAYVSGSLTRVTQLPTLLGLKGFSFVTNIIGQYSAIALPLTEEAGLGGQSLVRGFTLDDGAFDTALVSRNELRTPVFPAYYPGTATSPYIFVDSGFGKSQVTHHTVNAASTGLGLDLQLGRHIAATFEGAFALETEGVTHAGDAMLDTRITVSF